MWPEDEPTLAEALDALRGLDVVRALMRFDQFVDAYHFAVSFRDGWRDPTDDLQDALMLITSLAVTPALPEFDDDAAFDEWADGFAGGAR